MGWRQMIQCCRIERDEELLVENERRNGCEFYCCQHATKEAMKYGTTGHTALPDDQPEDDFEHLHQFPTDCKFTSPVVPFAGELPVPIDKGRIIEVAGKIHPSAIRFSVNLACGTGPLCDLAFHFNPRFDQNIIVRCYRRNGSWGEEECAAPARNPLQRGTDFIITIFAGDKEFMVAINGKHYCSYAYRMDLLHIRIVELHGDVTLNFIDYRKTDMYPEKIPTMPEEDVLTEDGILDSIGTPYLCTLSTQFKQGKCIEIVGRVKRLPHSFYVNLQNGTHLWPHPTIALHINPRFRTGSQYSVILNSWVDQQWGTEQTAPLLFTPGRPFLISIICRAHYYNVTLDGVKLGQYSHRAPPELVTALFIHGDVIVKSIRMR